MPFFWSRRCQANDGWPATVRKEAEEVGYYFIFIVELYIYVLRYGEEVRYYIIISNKICKMLVRT